MPWRSISSAIASMYDGVTMMIVGLEVVDQLHLPLGLPAGHRDHRAAQPLGAVVRAEAAGEQAVAVGDVDDVAGAPAGRADRARHHRRPGVDVLAPCSRRPSACPVVPDDAWMRTTCSRGTANIAERVVVAQVLLGRERELREVGERLQVARMHAGRVELAPVVRHVARRRGRSDHLQALELQRRELVAARGLDRLEFAGSRAC